MITEKKYKARKGAKSSGLWTQLCSDYNLIRDRADYLATDTEVAYNNLTDHSAFKKWIKEQRNTWRKITADELRLITKHAQDRELWNRIVDQMVRRYTKKRVADEVEARRKRAEYRERYAERNDQPAPAPQGAPVKLRRPKRRRMHPQVAGQRCIGQDGTIGPPVPDKWKGKERKRKRTGKWDTIRVSPLLKDPTNEDGYQRRSEDLNWRKRKSDKHRLNKAVTQPTPRRNLDPWRPGFPPKHHQPPD